MYKYFKRIDRRLLKTRSVQDNLQQPQSQKRLWKCGRLLKKNYDCVINVVQVHAIHVFWTWDSLLRNLYRLLNSKEKEHCMASLHWKLQEEMTQVLHQCYTWWWAVGLWLRSWAVIEEFVKFRGKTKNSSWLDFSCCEFFSKALSNGIVPSRSDCQ